jgi:uncharacterized protein YbcV (DUF1398 family)
MFTIEQIQKAHSKVKSGADFPNYIKELKTLDVKAYETYVNDGHTIYYNEDNQSISSPPKYPGLEISDECNPNQFRQYLELHQQGKTDYLAFCKHCAETGIEKWLVDLKKLVCVYFAKENTLVYEEEIPE